MTIDFSFTAAESHARRTTHVSFLGEQLGREGKRIVELFDHFSCNVNAQVLDSNPFLFAGIILRIATLKLEERRLAQNFSRPCL